MQVHQEIFTKLTHILQSGACIKETANEEVILFPSTEVYVRSKRIRKRIVSDEWKQVVAFEGIVRNMKVEKLSNVCNYTSFFSQGPKRKDRTCLQELASQYVEDLEIAILAILDSCDVVHLRHPSEECRGPLGRSKTAQCI